MSENKTEGQRLKEQLLVSNKNGWDETSEQDRKTIREFCDDYIAFLNRSKTERECVKSAVEIAEKNGFKPLEKMKKLKAGDKVYSINRGKNIILSVIGTESLESGLRVV